MALFLRIVDGHLLSMQSSQMIVPSFGDHHPVLDEHATHQRVRADLSAAAFCNQEGVLHEHAITLTPISAHVLPNLLLFMTACIAARFKLGEDERNMQDE